MKRFNLIVIVLVFIAGAVVTAQEFAPNVTVSGEAKFEVIFDLEKGTGKIANSIKTDLVLELVPKGTVDKSGDVYGYIEVKDFAIKIDSDDITEFDDGEVTVTNDTGSTTGFIDVDGDGNTGSDEDDNHDDFYLLRSPLITEPSITAKIFLAGPAFFVRITNVDVKTDAASAIKLKTIKDAGGTEKPAADVSTDAGETGSITIGSKTSILDASVTLGDNDGDDGNELTLGAKVALKAVPGLTLEAALGLDDLGGETLKIGAGAKTGYDFAGIGLPLKLDVGFDVSTPNDEDEADIELVAGVKLDVGLTAELKFGTDTKGHALLAKVASGSLLDFLNASVEFELGLPAAAEGEDAKSEIGLKAKVDVPIAGILKPYVTFRMAALEESHIELDAGIEATVIENVKFDLKFDSAIDKEFDASKIVFTTTIAY